MNRKVILSISLALAGVVLLSDASFCGTILWGYRVGDQINLHSSFTGLKSGGCCKVDSIDYDADTRSNVLVVRCSNCWGAGMFGGGRDRYFTFYSRERVSQAMMSKEEREEYFRKQQREEEERSRREAEQIRKEAEERRRRDEERRKLQAIEEERERQRLQAIEKERKDRIELLEQQVRQLDLTLSQERSSAEAVRLERDEASEAAEQLGLEKSDLERQNVELQESIGDVKGQVEALQRTIRRDRMVGAAAALIMIVLAGLRSLLRRSRKGVQADAA